MKPSYEGSKVTLEMLTDCVKKAQSTPTAKSAKNPNKADGLTIESFSMTVDALAESFNKVLKDYYGSK